MTISCVKVLSMPVPDHDRTKQVYAEAFGLEVQADHTLGGNRWLPDAPKGAATWS